VLVVGYGKLGRLIAQTLALTGCRLTVATKAVALPPHSEKFDIAVECTGGSESVNSARVLKVLDYQFGLRSFCKAQGASAFITNSEGSSL